VVAVAGNRSATITWVAPVFDGGATITGFTVVCVAGTSVKTVNAGAQAASAKVTGLTNGTTYTCGVTARNAAGSGAASIPATVTPIGPPGAPTSIVAKPGDAIATVTWNAPASDGGSPITGYSVNCVSADASVSVSADASPLVLTGLTNGTAWSCSVTAINAVGAGRASAAKQVTPRRTPDAPTAVTAIAHSRSAQLTWAAPAFDGGAPITGYVATCNAGTVVRTARVGATATTATVGGLTNGTAYTCTVSATNAAGKGTGSDPLPVTPG
jgi:hypothetical protein